MSRDVAAFQAEMNRRWEQGVEHDPRSVEIARTLMEADVIDYFRWKIGGDGDNLETLQFELDVLFAARDAKAKEPA